MILLRVLQKLYSNKPMNLGKWQGSAWIGSYVSFGGESQKNSVPVACYEQSVSPAQSQKDPHASRMECVSLWFSSVSGTT